VPNITLNLFYRCVLLHQLPGVCVLWTDQEWVCY
jgi:hypothetical protein